VRPVRSGCRGCLSTIVGLVVAAAAIAVGAWVVIGLFQAPDVERVRFSADDGVRAQRKLLELARQRPRASTVITEAEVNAFVTRHLDPADLPLVDPVIHLRGEDAVEIAGTVTIGRLLHDSPVAPLTDALPAGWQTRPIWLTVAAGARVTTDGRRILRLEPRRLTIGRQRVPTFLLRLVLDPGALRLLRITLPADVGSIRVEPARVIIERASSPPRTSSADHR